MKRRNLSEITKNPTEIGGISRAVTHLSGEPDEKKLSVNFEFYNTESCEVLNKKYRAEYSKSLFRKVLETFINVCGVNASNLGNANIRTSPISSDDKKYEDLFKTIPEDASLQHHNVGQKERLFYFCNTEYFFPIAITVKHR